MGAAVAPRVFCVSLGEGYGVLAFNGIVLEGSLAAVVKALLEWTKVAACAERPVGVLFWKFGDAAANWISRHLISPPDATPPKLAASATTATGQPASEASGGGPSKALTATGAAATTTTMTTGATCVASSGSAGSVPAIRRRPLILFDGVCLLCSSFIQFVLDHDAAGSFDFAALQSDYAKAALAEHGMTSDLSTMVLLDEQGMHIRSSAALRVLARCGLKYNLLATTLLWLLPCPLRDLGYKGVAAGRYRLFGQDDGSSCRRMTKAVRARFLDYQ